MEIFSFDKKKKKERKHETDFLVEKFVYTRFLDKGKSVQLHSAVDLPSTFSSRKHLREKYYLFILNDVWIDGIIRNESISFLSCR